jgi:hypothetical protein
MLKNSCVSTWILASLGVCAWVANPPAARPAQADAGKVTAVRLRLVPDSYAGPCPGKVQLVGDITTDGPGTVWYHFLAGAVSHSPEGTVIFSAAGTQTVTVEGSFRSAPQVPNASLLAAMQDQNGQHGPRNVTSGPVPYNITCGGPAQAAPTAAAAGGGGAASPGGLPAESTVEAKYADGTPIPFKLPEQVAFLFVHNIGSLEKDPCMRYLQRLCSLDELVQGVKGRPGGEKGLKRNPARETDYSYQVTFFGEPYQTAARYQVEAIHRQPGLGGFLYISDRRGFSNFYYNANGAATTKDKKLGEYGSTGDGFVAR